MSESEVRPYEAVRSKAEDLVSEEDLFISDEELEAYISELEQELGMARNEFLAHVRAGTEPDTFAAMALKAIQLYL